MARIIAMLLAVSVCFGASALAAEGEVRTCALTKAIECSPDEGCVEWSIQEMGLPRFIRIDLGARVITSLDKDVARSSKIATVERQEGLVVLHGTEQRGWSVALGEDSGTLTLTAAGGGEGFIVFGNCLAP